MNQLIIWLQLKKSILELWLLNVTVAFINLTSLQSIASIGLILLTAGYTIWKWVKEYKESKKK